MAPPKLCFNRECSDPASEPLRKGWPLRAGNFAELCHRCASAYEDGRFCEIFHINHNGWRDCESCRKSMHCGCIVSVQDFILLDSGGVKCMACATEKPNTVTNQISPPPAKRPVPEFKDISVRNWNGFAAPSVVSGQLWQSPNSNMTTLAPPKSELHAWMSREHRSSDPDKLTPGGSDRMEKRPSLESSVKASVGRMLFSLHDSCLNASVLPSTANEDQSIQHFNMPQSYRPPSEMNAGVSGTQPYRQMPQPPLSKQLHANSQIGVESSNETQNRNGKPRGDARGRNQLPLPRYWPKITDQELQQISGDSNAVITPLFEKILSASDAGRIGRLVLPKKCAEAYLPSISQPEGIPLEVQDLKGNKWTFQFRFWPNNNSRMYVLEGVTPCIQSMQLQAGDTVTFSRLDPEGKLVMGFRKVSYVPPSDQDNQRLKAGASVSTNSEVDLTNPANTWPKVKKSGCIAKEGFAGEPSLIPGKRKNSSLGSRSKRLQVGNDDIIELQIKWEDIFGLLRPPPNHVHGIVVIEGHEIEEFKEPPIVGKPTIFAEDSFGVNIQWVQCEDCTKWRKVPIDALLASRWTCSDNLWDKKRSSCSSDEELTATGLHELLNSNNIEKMKTVKKDAEAVDGSEGLDTLANLAILGEGGVLPSSVQPSTTKHPRHKPGCSCIVCIQPPSGQFPKHSDTCLCNACLIVKRRFRTLTERRGKRQLENETETRQQKQLVVEPQMSSNAMNKNNGLNHKSLVCGVADDTTIVKGGIDLNIQPERDDDQFQPSASGSMMRLVRDGNDKFHEQLESADSSRQFVERVEPSIDGSGGNKLKSSVFHGY